MSGFVAVLLGPPAPGSPEQAGDRLRAALAAAGALAVLHWSELTEPASGAGGTADDDRPAVLLDPGQDPADLRRVLDLLAADGDGPVGRLRGTGDTVVATTRPVTDTLKLVAGDGRLTGTADRERHRFVDLPIAAPLGLLRAAAERLAMAAAAEAAMEFSGPEQAQGGPAEAVSMRPMQPMQPMQPMRRVGPVDVLGALAGAGATVLSCPAGTGPHRTARAAAARPGRDPRRR
jgi:hypothetical protein